jgi:hypothetical protein
LRSNKKAKIFIKDYPRETVYVFARVVFEFGKCEKKIQESKKCCSKSSYPTGKVEQR